MNSIRITVKPIPSTTTEEARDARARALRYAFERYFEKQKAVKASGGEKGYGEQQTPSEPDKNRRQ
jgi:hypothetical protein